MKIAFCKLFLAIFFRINKLKNSGNQLIITYKLNSTTLNFNKVGQVVTSNTFLTLAYATRLQYTKYYIIPIVFVDQFEFEHVPNYTF